MRQPIRKCFSWTDNKDLVADAQTLQEENLSEKGSVESARRLANQSLGFLGLNIYLRDNEWINNNLDEISIMLDLIILCLPEVA